MFVAIYVVILSVLFVFQQSGQLDLKHFDPEFVREPVPGLYFSMSHWIHTQSKAVSFFMKVCE